MCVVSGTVLNAATNEPLKKAKVWLYPSQSNLAPYTTISDESGRFILDDLDPGQYTLRAERAGFVTPRLTTPPMMVTLAAGHKISDLTITLTPQGVITGQVLDEDGEPVPNAAVQCLRVAYPDGKRRVTPLSANVANDIGEYRLPNLPPGKYYVNASGRSLAIYPGRTHERVRGAAQTQKKADEIFAQTFYPNAMRLESAATIDIRPGTVARGVDVRLVRVRAVIIRGRIVNLQGGTSANASVQLLPNLQIPAMSYSNRSGDIEPDGSFEMPAVVPGSYTLIADQNYENKRYSTRLPVEVTDANLDKIELTLAAPGEIAGRLVIEGHSEAKLSSPVFVNLVLKGLSNRVGRDGAQVGDDLSFRMSSISPDEYEVRVPKLPDEYFLKSVRIGDRDITLGADFTHGIPAEEMIVTISLNGGQVEGTVQNEKGDPAADAGVTLVPETRLQSLDYLYKAAVSDQNGHLKIVGARPGRYRVLAWEEIEAGAYMDPDFLKPYESAGEDVTVDEKGRSAVQLKAIPAGRMK